jgi:hypothetical protein
MLRCAASRAEWQVFAAEIWDYQVEHSPVAKRLAAGAVRSNRALAVPTDAFKYTRVGCIEVGEETQCFQTSGTSIGARGTHAFWDTETYRAAAVAHGKACLLGDMPVGVEVLVLGPSLTEAPDSSLTFMNSAFVAAWNQPEPSRFLLPAANIDIEAIRARVARCGDLPIALLATSFALVHLFDALGTAKLPLPAGSRVMQTGGYKGKSREVPRSELNRQILHTFGLQADSLRSEYGMTELSSQFYATGENVVYTEPAWAWLTPVDTVTLEPVPRGEVGIARIDDALNIDSAVAIQTQDLVRALPGGFELLGRLPGAPARGCSIAMDEILAGRNA